MRGWFENNNPGGKMVVVANKETGFFFIVISFGCGNKKSKNEL